MQYSNLKSGSLGRLNNSSQTMSTFLSAELMNVTLYGWKDSAGITKRMFWRGEHPGWSIWVQHNDKSLDKREAGEWWWEREAEVIPGGGQAPKSAGASGCWKREGNTCSLELPEGMKLTPWLQPSETDLRLLTSRTARQQICVILSQQVCRNLLQQPQETNIFPREYGGSANEILSKTVNVIQIFIFKYLSICTREKDNFVQ